MCFFVVARSQDLELLEVWTFSRSRSSGEDGGFGQKVPEFLAPHGFEALQRVAGDAQLEERCAREHEPLGII